MRCTAIILSVSAFVSGAFAVANGSPELAARAWSYSSWGQSKNLGASIPPWKKGCSPGWAITKKPLKISVPFVFANVDFVCKIIKLFGLEKDFGKKFCRSVPTGPTAPQWKQSFSSLLGAVQAGDYMTYGLVDNIDQCKNMCEQNAGCVFFNTYYDNNGKEGDTSTPHLTCSLFSGCHSLLDATNIGGQDSDNNGSLSFITESHGWCRA